MKYLLAALFWLLAAPGLAGAGEIEPTWESMAQHYRVPQWFQDEPIRWKRDASALGIVLPKSLPTQPVVGFRIILN